MKGNVLAWGAFVVVTCLLPGCVATSGPTSATGDAAGGDVIKDHGQKAEGDFVQHRAKKMEHPE